MTGLLVTSLAALALAASASERVSAVPASALLAVSPVSTLTMPAEQPRGIAIDRSGTVYVTGYGGGVGTRAFVFEPGATTTTSTLTGLQSPWDVAIQPTTGEVYVSNYWRDTVSVFRPGEASPTRTLIGVRAPVGLAFDLNGNLLVSSYVENNVAVFEAGHFTPSRVIPTVAEPGGIAVDPLSNYLYVTSPNTGEVAVYDLTNGQSVPGLWLSGLGMPWDLDLQLSTGVFFVSEYQSGRVSAYVRGTTTADGDRSLTGVSGPMGVAVSPRDGAVYVSDARDIVLVYPPLTSAVTVVEPIGGPVTGGTAVTIQGENLGAVTAVTFNGVEAELTGPALPGSVQVESPAMPAAGPVTIAVTWGARTAGKDGAFTYHPVAPGPAMDVSAAPGDERATVAWAEPAFTGGVPVSGYNVTAAPGSAACATTSTSCTITGLANGTEYTFVVTTTNRASLTSESAPSNPVTPAPTPPPFTAEAPPAPPVVAPPPATISSPTVAVSVKAVSGTSKLHIDVNPNKGKGHWTFTVQRKAKNGSWGPYQKTYKTLGRRRRPARSTCPRAPTGS